MFIAKLGLLAMTASVVSVLTFATFSASAEDAAAPCVTKDFRTELVKSACTKGGQKEAITAMKKFNVEKRLKSCTQCHSKLKPNYELKPDGLEQFHKLGGK